MGRAKVSAVFVRLGAVARLLALAGLVTLGLVVPSGPASAATTVDTPQELADAFQAGGEVVLGADITVASDGPVIAVPAGKAVTLDLHGHDLQVTGADQMPGVGVPSDAALVIENMTGRPGSLEASGGDAGAGVGGGLDGDAGSVTVNGGTVTATGGGMASASASASGIGGGYQGDGGSVTVNGGALTATGAFFGAGIGGGGKGAGGSVTVNGGTVKASGGNWGAGIGGGGEGAGGSVTVNGGTVKASGGNFGAGLGGGADGVGGSVTVNGGTVTATGGRDAAGIGGGSGGAGALVTIGSGASVSASGTTGIAVGPGGAVGFGSLANAGTLTIPEKSSITIPAGVSVPNSGTITGAGAIVNHGAIVNTGTVNLSVSDHSYLLSFDANGGTGGPDDLRVYAATLANAGLDVPSQQPSRTGYDFTGWYFDGAGTDGPLTASTTLSGQKGPQTVALYAGWDTRAPNITTVSLPDGEVGVDYSAQLEATGGVAPYTWTIPDGSLPDGLALSTAGKVTGTPTTAGDTDVTVTVTDTDGGSATTTLPLQVVAAPSVTTTSLPEGEVGVSYATQLQASGGVAPYAWAITGGALPDGVSLTGSGKIEGTPTTAGDFVVTVTVTDANGGTDSQKLAVHVVGAPAVTTTSLPDGEVGESYTAVLQASGGVTPYAWAVTSGALPEGLSLAKSGKISGTPTEAGDFAVTVAVTDANGGTDSQELAVHVATAPTETVLSQDSRYTVDGLYGKPVTFTATVTSHGQPVDGGTVTFTAVKRPLLGLESLVTLCEAAPVDDGLATCTVSLRGAVATYTVTASYSDRGGDRYAPSTSNEVRHTVLLSLLAVRL